MTNKTGQHVFISYVRENQDEIDRLARDLDRHGVNVWLDRHSIKPGARWKDAIREAIRHGDFFIACFSDEYTTRSLTERKKTYMNEELTLATEELRQYASNREWFIPVLLNECDVPARSIGAGETLLDINWVPLYENWDTGIQRILSVIKPIPLRIQNLIYALHSKDRAVCRRAANALLETDDPVVLAALIEALEDKNSNVCACAAEALGEIGPEAKAAVPALIKVLKDEDKNVRWSAVWALGKIGPESNSAVPALSKSLKDKDNYVRQYATVALWEINTPNALKALKEYFRSPTTNHSKS